MYLSVCLHVYLYIFYIDLAPYLPQCCTTKAKLHKKNKCTKKSKTNMSPIWKSRGLVWSGWKWSGKSLDWQGNARKEPNWYVRQEFKVSRPRGIQNNTTIKSFIRYDRSIYLSKKWPGHSSFDGDYVLDEILRTSFVQGDGERQLVAYRRESVFCW